MPGDMVGTSFEAGVWIFFVLVAIIYVCVRAFRD